MKGGQYQRDEEERKCKVCREEEETIEHILKNCESTKGDISIEDLFDGDGRGVKVIKKSENNRKREKRRRKEK